MSWLSNKRADSQETLLNESTSELYPETTSLLKSSTSTSSLLIASTPASSDALHYSTYGRRCRAKKPYRIVAKQEFEWLAASSVPIVATYFLQFSLGFANFVAIGNLGAKELAATSLAYMVS
ncbi:hypothetical protein GQ54DRAFT_307770, partial [Martensiomyces pterosporus]